MALDAAGAAYVVGYTASPDLPTLGAPKGALGGAHDAFVARLAPSTCPAPWTCADIGAPPPGGGQTLSSTGVWAVAGTGDAYGPADATRYVWQPVAGDMAAAARVLTGTVAGAYAKAGLMVRASADPSAPMYYVVRNAGDGGLAVGWRATQAVTPTYPAYVAPSSVPAPVYLRVTRSGNTLGAAYSADGAAWTAIAGATATLPRSPTALVGLAVSTQYNVSGTVQTTAFDSVSITATAGQAAAPSATNLFSYTADGLPYTATLGAGAAGQVRERRTYDADNHLMCATSVGPLTALTTTAPYYQSFGYAHSPLGATVAITTYAATTCGGAAPSAAQYPAYDALGRLTGSAGARWAYDGDGNTLRAQYPPAAGAANPISATPASSP